jgi:hypothetical protein
MDFWPTKRKPYPGENTQNFRKLPALLQGMPPEINAWVIGIGNPKITYKTTEEETPNPTTTPGLTIPTEHIEIASAIRKTGRQANVSILDISKQNLRYAKITAWLHKTLTTKPPNYTYHNINLDELNQTPTQRPHVISIHNTLDYLENQDQTTTTLLQALQPNGLLLTNKNKIIELYNKGLITEKKWKQEAPGIIRKKT